MTETANATWKYTALGIVFVGLVALASFLVTREAARGTPPDAIYTVTGETIALSSGVAEPWHDHAWTRFVELVPASRRGLVAEFHALPFSDVGGLVEASSNSLQNWSLAIGPPASDEDLDNTLVHEYAHLITLSPTQVIPATSRDVETSCTTYFTGEGCAREGSIFDRFLNSHAATDGPGGIYAGSLAFIGKADIIRVNVTVEKINVAEGRALAVSHIDHRVIDR